MFTPLMKFLAAIMYSVLHLFALIIWFFDMLWILMASILHSIGVWLSENLYTILPIINEPFAAFLGFTLLLAIIVYAVSRMASSFTNWNPVDPAKAIMYGALGFFYLTSGVVLIESIELLRTNLASEMSDATANIFVDMMADVTVNGDGFSLGSPSEVDGYEGTSGIDVAGSYLGMKSPDDLGLDIPSGLITGYQYTPSGMDDCCFMYVNDYAAFDQMEDDERSEVLDAAVYGIRVLIMGYLLTPYAFLSELAWFVLTLAALIIFISLPFGFVFAPFRSTQNLLTGYINKYIMLLKETMITAVLLGAGYAMILSTLQMSLVLLFPVNILVSLLALWRVISAFKILGNSFNGLTSGLTGGGESAEQGMKSASGLLMGAGLAGAGLATGNIALAKYGAMSAHGALQGGRGVSPAMFLSQVGSMGNNGNENGRNSNGNGKQPGNGSRLQQAPDTPEVNNQPRPGAAISSANGNERDIENDNFGTIPSQTQPTVEQIEDMDNHLALNAKRRQLSQPHISANRAIKSWGDDTPSRLTQYKPDAFGVAGQRIHALSTNPETAEDTDQAATWMSQYIDRMGSDTDVIDSFRSGDAYHAAQEHLPDSSIFVQDENNFNALADMMMPQQQVEDFGEIVSAMSHVSPREENPVEGTMVNLGGSRDFGSYNGLITNIHQTASSLGALEQMDDDTTFLEKTYEFVADGESEKARDLLNEIAPFDEGGAMAESLIEQLEVGNAQLGNYRVSPSIAYSQGDKAAYEHSYMTEPPQVQVRQPKPSQAERTEPQQAEWEQPQAAEQPEPQQAEWERPQAEQAEPQQPPQVQVRQSQPQQAKQVQQAQQPQPQQVTATAVPTSPTSAMDKSSRLS